MNSEQELLQKLMISKKIMEKHNSINRGSIDESRISTPQLENFELAIRLAATRTLASDVSTAGLLPPSSNVTGTNFSAACL
jgi:hypothetical protein